MSQFFYDVLHLYDNDSYEALAFTPNSMRVMISFIWIGVVIAFIGSYYSNNYLGKFVQKLISSGANSPENALTLEQIGSHKNPIIAFSLREGSVLRKTVLVAQNEKAEESEEEIESEKSKKIKKSEKENVRTLSFYIPEDKQDKAKNRYRTKGNGIISLIISIAFSFIILMLLLIFGPWLLGFVDGILNSMK